MNEEREPCCFHFHAQPWPVSIGGRQVMVMPRVCCQHGEAATHFSGIEEEGHGPFISHESAKPSLIMATPTMQPMGRA